jgi:LysR family transcriptional regulator, glycine cleavage system transcriptional activator
MSDRLPPLGALRAFDAVARHLSIKDAADELSVTSGAVSLQIKNLEAAVGVPLFLRHARRMTLSPEGQRYFLSVSAAFRVLKDATSALHSNRDSVLTLSCTQGFALQWLVPRLAGFTATAPTVDVRISISQRLADFKNDGVDFAVRHGLGRYPGLHSEKLLDDALLAVASPTLLNGMPPLRNARDLRHFTLLHDEHREDWKVWLAAAGENRGYRSDGPLFTGNGALEAAVAGRGVALLRESFIRSELERGLLVKVLPRTLKIDTAYYLVYPRAALARKEAEIFRNWLLEQAAQP